MTNQTILINNYNNKKGLPREFECSVAMSIREQVYNYRRLLVTGDEKLKDFRRAKPIVKTVRTKDELQFWTPRAFAEK